MSITLPQIMVAPNGARRTKADHPALPVSIEETVEAAKACYAAGAGALHAHVRDDKAEHVLDAGRYRELIEQMRQSVPQMAVQITTEAVGRYTAAEQRQVVRDVLPSAVSIALREMLPDPGETSAARIFYHWAREADITIQHILYEPADLSDFFVALEKGIIPAGNVQLLFVLGRYVYNQQSRLSDIDPYLSLLEQHKTDAVKIEWGLCAFGQQETACLVEAVRRGGAARIGFENNLHNRDGSIARDNAERVAELRGLLS